MILLCLGLLCWVIAGVSLLRLAFVLIVEAIYGSVDRSEIPFYFAFIGMGFWIFSHPVAWAFIFGIIYMVFK